MSEFHSPAEPESADPVGPPPPPPPGPIAQSVAIGFRTVYVAGLLLLILWLTGNVREIASDSQVVVMRFGRIVRAQEAGLLVAWPRPIEQTRLLPGPERLLTQDVATLAPATEVAQGLIGPFAVSQGIPQNATAYLTGDGNVVLLNATLIYRINDPISYALAQSHVAPALDRLFRATTAHVTAARRLDDFLVVQAAQAGAGNQSTQALRGEVRSSLIQDMNTRLRALADQGAPLGVEIERIDMTAWLPPQAKSAFDAVLIATQTADRGLAVARTDAERRRQESSRLHDQLLADAQARALEFTSSASVNTAAILALEHEVTPATRGSLLLREYRTKVADIMNKVGSATLIDPQGGARILLPGKTDK
ncbi:MAG TPA: SPFH domain-containing protein [Steroidobacteraceae bacterium]|nr:SPFH domain-containing protein [Steroidobacteraceae bacterium]